MHRLKHYALPPLGTATEGANSNHIAQAIRAMEENRISDAKSHIKQIHADILLHGAWKYFLEGCTFLIESDPDRAESCFEQCIQQSARSTDPNTYKLFNAVDLLQAAAFEKLGFIHRRQERLEDAKRNHEEAYELRKRSNSPDGCWESAISLGLDAVVARKFEEARNWFHQATEHAATSSVPYILEAIALEHLAIVLIELHQIEEAVEAAEQASDLRRTHDPGSVATALCEATLGRAQLRLAQKHIEQGESANPLLESTLCSLRHAHDELSAFGPACPRNLGLLNEQIDFAHRLLQSTSETYCG
ncbi:MAG: tetratricopeptide repeat protein [Planctomycetes bacterium]|nr:tetratricopeptide repeat protein [Planctomycetota bacterium]MBI3834076.1 tetratricopeptide repeat protein [Planctomycetota bacterium]